MLHGAFTHVEVARVRLRSRRELLQDKERVREEARMFCHDLVADEDDERLAAA